LFWEAWTLEDAVMPRAISICRPGSVSLGAVIGLAGWLAACSDPPQPQTQAPAQTPGQTLGQTKASVQKAPATAMVASQPDPATIGKRQSHGCVRLTNWDAVELGKAVRKGAKVLFLGTEKKA
jgi:hypothetical protein